MVSKTVLRPICSDYRVVCMRLSRSRRLRKQWLERNLTVLDLAFGVLYGPLWRGGFLLGRFTREVEHARQVARLHRKHTRCPAR